MDSLNKSFLKYDIDSTACTQRIVCWYVKNAALNRANGIASNVEKIIDGLSNADWALEMTTGTAIYDAITAGRSGKHCGTIYSTCKLGARDLDQLTKKILSQNKKNRRT